MNAIKLNSLPNDLFSVKSIASPSQTLKFCAADGKVKSLDRKEIIAMGRLATVEYFGRLANMDKDNLVKYNSRVQNYGNFQKSVWEDTLLYCANLAAKAVGKDEYTSLSDIKNDRGLYKNQTFWTALQYIAEEVITPLYATVISDATGRLITWDTGELGVTKAFSIESNDFFLFEDDSWGAVSSKPKQYLYKDQIFVTPKPYTATTKIKWYQDVVGGEAGRFYAAFARGAYNKMYATTMEKFKAAVANTKYLPSSFTRDYSTANWIKTLQEAEALNGVKRGNLMALGTLAGLNQILPIDGVSGAVAGIQGEIGVEWVRNGFLANVSGVDLVEMELAVVPGTQNYDPKYIGLDDNSYENIYVVAKAGYAPMVGVVADGSPITITFTPEQTADMTIDITETLVYDIQPAFSQKIFKLRA